MMLSYAGKKQRMEREKVGFVCFLSCFLVNPFLKKNRGNLLFFKVISMPTQGASVAQLVEHLTLARVMIWWFVGFEPRRERGTESPK